MVRINLDAIEQEPILGHTSKGDQPKWQLDGKWYKADHMGYDHITISSFYAAKSRRMRKRRTIRITRK